MNEQTELEILRAQVKGHDALIAKIIEEYNDKLLSKEKQILLLKEQMERKYELYERLNGVAKSMAHDLNEGYQRYAWTRAWLDT